MPPIQTRRYTATQSPSIFAKLKKAQVLNLRLKRTHAELFEPLHGWKYPQCSGPGNGLRPAVNTELEESGA
jgi:hypothetical protein